MTWKILQTWKITIMKISKQTPATSETNIELVYSQKLFASCNKEMTLDETFEMRRSNPPIARTFRRWFRTKPIHAKRLRPHWKVDIFSLFSSMSFAVAYFHEMYVSSGLLRGWILFFDHNSKCFRSQFLAQATKNQLNRYDSTEIRKWNLKFNSNESTS